MIKIQLIKVIKKVFCLHKHFQLPFKALFYYKVNILSPITRKNFSSLTQRLWTFSSLQPWIMTLSSVWMTIYLSIFLLSPVVYIFVCTHVCEYTNTHTTHIQSNFSNPHRITRVNVANISLVYIQPTAIYFIWFIRCSLKMLRWSSKIRHYLGRCFRRMLQKNFKFLVSLKRLEEKLDLQSCTSTVSSNWRAAAL